VGALVLDWEVREADAGDYLLGYYHNGMNGYFNLLSFLEVVVELVFSLVLVLANEKRGDVEVFGHLPTIALSTFGATFEQILNSS
jgi:hypothetical protein